MPGYSSLKKLFEDLESILNTPQSVQISGLPEPVIQLLLSNVAQRKLGNKLIIVLPSPRDLTIWMQFFEANGCNSSSGPLCTVLPFFSSFGNDRFIDHGATQKSRMFSLSQLFDSTVPQIVLTTMRGLLQKTLSMDLFHKTEINLSVELEYDQEQLVQAVADLGYVQASVVDEEGKFSVRGGIFDIFPLNSLAPIRVEFIGDSISSIREFDVQSQRSKSSKKSCRIGLAHEWYAPSGSRKVDAQKVYNHLLDQNIPQADRDGMINQFLNGLFFNGIDMFAPFLRESSRTAMDLASESGARFFYPRTLNQCLKDYLDFFDELTKNRESDIARERSVVDVELHFSEASVEESSLPMHSYVEFGNPFVTDEARHFRMESRLVVEKAPPLSQSASVMFDRWIDVILDSLQAGTKVGILFVGDDQRERIENLLNHRNLPFSFKKDLLRTVLQSDVDPVGIYLSQGDLASHIQISDSGWLLLPDHNLFGSRPRTKKTGSRKLQNYLSSFADLKPGDLVVHVMHGIGKYNGLTNLSIGGASSDFLVIEYAGADKIYLPVDRLSLLQRYTSGGEASSTHTLDRLGTQTWEKRKSKAKGAAKDMAAELLSLQAKRAVADAPHFSAPEDSYLKFEASFPYEETEDQLKAIMDVESDVRSARAMDRLVCGDVGFGKTEVALRAAFRSVLEGYQVLVLVPTTVLCYQHYRTFADRLTNFGVTCAYVNRFVKGVDEKSAIEGLNRGTVDILIGTHRLLSKDIKPKRLGLLIIDEEQRFGVTHKEKLKHLRSGAHVLTLSATPIPRTLHLAMVGLRDISLIATPPQERIAIKTYVSRFDDELIKDAIQSEIRRGGQVFFVHNRVEDIEEVASYLKRLIPNIEVRVGHGQMREHQLEKVILDFVEHKFPVLLCTTIIESGIDMPNVNTLIVNRADRFGLAQLYQLRGRVGRSSRQAYAYFLTPAVETLTEDAQKRLDILSAFQELGAGFQIASFDLEMRGAGNLLGGEQSGHASTVGLEMYTQMLDEAIAEVRGESVRQRRDTEIKIPVNAFIPVSYIAAERHRLHMYKSIFGCESDGELRQLRDDLRDRYGEEPPEVQLLFLVARLKMRLASMNAVRLSAGKGVYEIVFGVLDNLFIDRLMKAVKFHPETYQLAPDNRLLIKGETTAGGPINRQEEMLTALLSKIIPLSE
jgi:transcription-repair coupling factor (superfamily II helicase)